MKFYVVRHRSKSSRKTTQSFTLEISPGLMLMAHALLHWLTK